MRTVVCVLSWLGLSLAACGPRVTPSVDGGEGSSPDGSTWVPGTDAGSCEEAIDVVFVLDVTSTMTFVLEDLEDGVGDVVAAANGISPNAHFGLISFSDNYLLDLGGDLEGGKVHTQAATLVAAFEEVQSTYTAYDRNPGDGPGGPTLQNPVCEENSLDSLYAAATEFPWRDNAARIIILATDDTFLEAPDNYGDRDGDGDTTSTSFPAEGDYPALRTVPETVAQLTAKKIRVFSFTRREEPGFLEGCSTPRRFGWDHITDGWTTNYGANAPIPATTDGKDYDLAAVQNGDLSLADTINEVVLGSHCNPVD